MRWIGMPAIGSVAWMSLFFKHEQPGHRLVSLEIFDAPIHGGGTGAFADARYVSMTPNGSALSRFVDMRDIDEIQPLERGKIEFP
jgi:hypothetical protein